MWWNDKDMIVQNHDYTQVRDAGTEQTKEPAKEQAPEPVKKAMDNY